MQITKEDLSKMVADGLAAVEDRRARDMWRNDDVYREKQLQQLADALERGEYIEILQ